MKPNLPPEWIAHDKSLKPYLWSHRIVGIVSSLVSLEFTILLLFYGWGKAWEADVYNMTANSFLRWALFFGGLALAYRLLSIPASLASQLIERHFGLSKQSIASWLGDQVKGLLVGAVIGVIALGLIYASVAYMGAYWWLGCACLLIGLSIVLAQLAPVLLIPIFYKLKPMEASELKSRLMALCEKFKIQVKDVYHLGLGEKTEKGNAAFLGLGKTKRIVIGDTLYERFQTEEVEAVFGHELGHQVHNDMWMGIAISSVMMLIGFGIAQWAHAEWVLGYFGSALQDPFGFYLFFIVLSIVQMPLGVFQAIYSRSREWSADHFAAKTIQMPKPLGDALERLTYQNRGKFRPNPIIEFLTYSHPAPWRRITALRQN